jgi:predicted membrane protein
MFMRRDIKMTVGLPGTGIGGIFYLSLAICMPIREFVRTLKGQTNLKRWGFIALQLLFVFGVVAAMWSELWLLNRLLIWARGTLVVHGLSLTDERIFHQTKFMALASATASFVSLAFVITAVHILRFFVHRAHRGQPLSAPKRPPTILNAKPLFLARKAS